RGLELMDAACAAGEPHIAPVDLDLGMARKQAGSGMLPPILRGLVRTPAPRAGTLGSLARRLAGTPDAQRDQVVLELVLDEVAAVLGDAPGDSQRGFTELGFDSLAAVELRNRLSQASGLRLPATLVFDYP